VRRARPAAGFTLIELTITIALLAWIVMLMTQLINDTIRGRDMAYNALRRPKIENAILGQIVQDLRYCWFGGLSGDEGFHGKALTMGGMDADRIAFVTARRTRTVGIEEDGTRRGNEGESPLTEVGYALDMNPENARWLRLWRREDYYVDSRPSEGGRYSLVYDRIRAFRLRYFPIPEELQKAESEGLEEWDSRVKKGVPYGVLLKIEFDTDEVAVDDLTDRPAELIYRLILLRPAYNVPFTGGPGATPGPGPGPAPGG
jgi:prepilin-type N-terminal cleavage/methylation domain-containing protein